MLYHTLPLTDRICIYDSFTPTHLCVWLTGAAAAKQVV